MKTNIFPLLLLFLLISCSAGTPQLANQRSDEVIEKKIYASHPRKPDWLTETPEDDTRYSYLVGISQKTTDEQAATDNAAAHATASFVKSCGVRVSILDSYAKESRGESTAGPIEQIVTGKSTEKQRANAFVSGLKIKSRYTEKYEVRQGGIKLRNSYFIALLFTVPLDECRRVKEWWKTYLNRFTKELERMITEAKSFAAAGNVESALKTTREAEQRIKESNIDSGDISYHFSMIRALKADYFARYIRQQVENAIVTASQFAAEGNLTGAFQTLFDARELVTQTVSEKSARNRYLALVTNAENRITGKVSIKAISNTHPRIEPGERPEPLTVSLLYHSPKGREPIGDFAIRFKGKTVSVVRKTNSKGVATYSLPAAPAAGRLEIKTFPDFQGLRDHASLNVIMRLSSKQALFVIDVGKKKAGQKMKDLVRELAHQINRLPGVKKPLPLYIGGFAVKDHHCSSPFLNNLRRLVREKTVRHQTFNVKGPVRVPENFDKRLNPDLAADQARMLQSHVLSGTVYPTGKTLTLNLTVTGANSRLASASTSIGGWFTKQKAITAGCRSSKAILDKIGNTGNQDFMLKLWTDNGSGTFRIGDNIDVRAQCSRRCYLKIFTVDDNGEITALADTGKKRLVRNKKVTIRLKANAKGVQSLIAIASTRPFPLRFQQNEIIPEKTFISAYETLRKSVPQKAEDRIVITIVNKSP